MILISWLFFAFCVAFVFGVARTIGFRQSLLWSLVLSPVVGLIITLCYPTLGAAKEKKEMLDNQKEQTALMKQQIAAQATNPISELAKLSTMLKDGHLTQTEFDTMKAKIIS